MRKLKVTLSNQDLDTIFGALVESENVDVADGELTDLFLTLTKMGVGVKLVSTEQEDVLVEDSTDVEIRGLVDSVLDVLEEVGDITDLEEGVDFVETVDNGFDEDGFDEDGYDREGYNRDGYDRDENHYDDGYDRDGYDRDGFDRDGYDRDDYDRDGFDDDGFDDDGFDDDGFDDDVGDQNGNLPATVDGDVEEEDDDTTCSDSKPWVVDDGFNGWRTN